MLQTDDDDIGHLDGHFQVRKKSLALVMQMEGFLVDQVLVLGDADVEGVVEVLQEAEVDLVQVEKGGTGRVYLRSIVEGAEETAHVEPI